jgi:hypothetical protein
MLEVWMGVYVWRFINGIHPWDKQSEDERDMVVLGSPSGVFNIAFDFDQRQLGCK